MSNVKMNQITQSYFTGIISASCILFACVLFCVYSQSFHYSREMLFSTKKVAKYGCNSLKCALMIFFFAFQILGGGGGRPLATPWTRA